MKKKEIDDGVIYGFAIAGLSLNEVKDTRNDGRMLGARYGRYRGKEYLFTHRNPKNGDLYGEDIPITSRSLILGKWVSSDSVEFN